MNHLYQLSYVLFISLFLFSACSTKLHKAASNGNFIEIETTSCLGSCPAFKLRLYADYAVYTGLSNVDLTGNYSAILPDSIRLKTSDLIDSLATSKTKTSYRSTKQLDLPSTYIRLKRDTLFKEISIYGTMPDTLVPIIDFMKSMNIQLDWKENSPSK